MMVAFGLEVESMLEGFMSYVFVHMSSPRSIVSFEAW